MPSAPPDPQLWGPLAWLDRLGSQVWFADAVVVGICIGIVGLAAVMSPSPEVLTLFGHEVPVVCGFRRLTGVGCPGCGLTRSFVFLAHLQPIEAFRINGFGPPLFVLVAAQIPWRIYRIAAGRAGA